MYQSKRLLVFNQQVKNKFNIYNGIFLNLPYRQDSNIGILIPVLYQLCRDGLAAGKHPDEILESFFENYVGLDSEPDKIDFLFRIVQYVERQVVLFDSVEDSAFVELKSLGNYLLIKDFFNLVDNRKSWDRILEKLSDFSARIVLTAHPTQFYSPSVLHIISRLRILISENEIDEIDMTLQQLGLTSLINSKKPTPLDEAKNIISFLRHVYYDAIGELYSYIKEHAGSRQFKNYNIIQLGFWPGGDRDGNPFVTPEITSAVADELRMNLLKCYYDDVKDIQRKLTFREVEDILGNLRHKLYVSMFNADERISMEEIIRPLLDVKEQLITRYHSIYLKELDGLIDKVMIFKTHFATLDIRQDHIIHHKTVEAILLKSGIIKDNFNELEPEGLIDLLISSDIKANPDDFDDPVIQDTIRNIMQLKAIQGKNGEQGCNRYVISNSVDKLSVLFVYGLFRWCGWSGQTLTFDIVPLFETMEGMQTAEATIQELFNIPAYRKHISQRGEKQTIMLGFSDGTKDGGYLMANWSIFKTKESLTAACEQHGIKAVFFDGRGGPPARGGGKTHRFYASQSDKIANHEIQLTIQGQTITSTYATHEKFIHNCEQLLTAGLANSISGKEHNVSDESRQLMEELALLSYEKYSELKAHEKFLPYLEKKSTLRFYDKTNIGSRPGKRTIDKKLELTDLRAISFVGSWSQLKQNVPGYFGTGTAIQRMVDEGKLDALKQLVHELPFFKALIQNSMMSLSKCNFDLTNYIREDEEFKDFWQILFDEYKLSVEMLLLITDSKELMEEEPISKESIKMREQIALPLLVIQQYGLQKIGESEEFKEAYEKLVTRSLYGNINAGRNSA